MFYLTKTPKWIIKLFSGSTWKMQANPKAIYLTFDDGPHPLATPFVLDELDKYNAKATFFCIGKNVEKHPGIFKRISDSGHAVGNHTHTHLNGWKTANAKYLQNILEARKYISSALFRPPYGKIKRKQRIQLQQLKEPFQVVMWTVLSGDFDIRTTPAECLARVLKNTESGSIIVFHDSEKAFERLSFTLPAVLQYFSEKGYQFKSITGKTGEF